MAPIGHAASYRIRLRPSGNRPLAHKLKVYTIEKPLQGSPQRLFGIVQMNLVLPDLDAFFVAAHHRVFFLATKGFVELRHVRHRSVGTEAAW